MAHSAELHEFWNAYRAVAPEAPERYFDAWAFGNTPAWADRLCGLVLDGVKTATAGSIWEYEHHGWPIHGQGDHIIILDGRNTPACVIQAVEVEIKPLETVAPQFALDEGEGFTSVEDWIAGHLDYFRAAWADIGLTPTRAMPMLFTRFRLAYRPRA